MQGLSVHSGGIGDLNKWALFQFSMLARQQRQERQEDVQEQLSQLLFGVDLSPNQLQMYRARLLDAIAKVDSLEQGQTEITNPGQLSVPRSKMMLQVGNLAWIPNKTTSKLIEVTPSHQIHSRNLAKKLKTLLGQNPKSVRRGFHSVGIVVARGGEGVRWGEDKVELTEWGLQVVNSQDYPKVRRLRLPPRFPTHAEMAKFRVS